MKLGEPLPLRIETNVRGLPNTDSLPFMKLGTVLDKMDKARYRAFVKRALFQKIDRSEYSHVSDVFPES